MEKKRIRARRWTIAQARTVLENLDSSGLSVQSFAVKHGHGVERLYRWRRRLGRGKHSATNPRFTELAIRPIGSGGSIEMEFHGVVVRIGGESRIEDAVAILSRVASR